MTQSQLTDLLADALEKQAVGAEFARKLAEGMAPLLMTHFRRKGREDLAAYYTGHLLALANRGVPNHNRVVVNEAFDLADAFLKKCLEEDAKDGTIT